MSERADGSFRQSFRSPLLETLTRILTGQPPSAKTFTLAGRFAQWQDDVLILHFLPDDDSDYEERIADLAGLPPTDLHSEARGPREAEGNWPGRYRITVERIDP